MNEGEIIKRIENYIELLMCDERVLELPSMFQKEWAEAIQGLLDLYKKEKKESDIYYYELKHLEAEMLNNYISKDKIKQQLHQCEKVYKKEMEPYQTEYGLDVTYLSKKEKEELINKRNCLLVQMKVYKKLLEE